MDTLLQNTYYSLQIDTTAEQDKRLLASQRTWLKQTRNSCMTDTCLIDVYKKRVDDLDPFADRFVSCDNMRQYPKKIFNSSIDLGSGFQSPIGVDYDCPKSLKSLAFLQNILTIAESIRSEDGPQWCTGSIIYAHWRYYNFDLAYAGFAPLEFKQSANVFQDGYRSRTPSYFKQWSTKSIYNFKQYQAFMSEFDKDLPLLTEHYQKAFSLSALKASEAARFALETIMDRAAGSSPQSSFASETDLYKLVNNPASKIQDIKKMLAGSASFSSEEMYKALEAALLQNRSKEFIALLLSKLSLDDIDEFQEKSEPLLSLAINNHENLKFLISKKIPIDSQNRFGKTALFYAVGLNDLEAAEILIASKANINHTYKSSTELRPEGDYVAECEFPNLKHTLRTTLMHAVQNSDVNMLKLLIKNGADLKAIDELGFNALDYAVMGKNTDNEMFLKDAGLGPGNKKDN